MSLLHYLAWSSKTSKDTLRKYHQLSNFDLRKVDAEGRSIVHLAAQRGNVPVIEYIIGAAKDFNINHSDSRGRTGLHYGVENKRAHHTISTLVSHGANVRAKDYHQRSVLHHAAKQGNLPAVKALLELGLEDELRVADRFGMTPLKLLSLYNNQDVLIFLAERKRGKQRTVPVLVGSCDLSAADIEDLSGRSSSTPALARYHALPVRPRQRSYWIDEGWKNLSRTPQRHGSELTDLKNCCNIVRFLAVMVAICTLVLSLTV